jgi:hypothetical protein
MSDWDIYKTREVVMSDVHAQQSLAKLTNFENKIYRLNSKGLLELDRNWTAVFGMVGAEQAIIGYKRSSSGYHEMVDREGTIVWSDEVGIEPSLISPIDIIGPSLVVGIARGLGVAGGRVLISRGIVVTAEQVAARGAGARLAAVFQRMAAVARSILARQVVAEVSGPMGNVARTVLEAAVADAGPTIRAVTNLTMKPQVGRALSVAVEEDADALAAAARSGGQTFTANIPKALIVQLERIGLASLKTTQMAGRIVGKEYRFLAEASEFIVPFFRGTP